MAIRVWEVKSNNNWALLIILTVQRADLCIYLYHLVAEFGDINTANSFVILLRISVSRCLSSKAVTNESNSNKK